MSSRFRDSGLGHVDWYPHGPVFVDSAESTPDPSPIVHPAERLVLPRSLVLHLSDLHITSQTQAMRLASQLHEDLRHEPRFATVHGVVVSGDIVDRALRIAVWHHPVSAEGNDRIRDTGFLERLAKSGFRLALHGHVHRARTDLFRYDMTAAGRRLDLLAAGTFGSRRGEWFPGIPAQYQLLEFDGGRVTVHTRRREEPNGAWKPDARWSTGPGADPLPRYTIDL